MGMFISGSSTSTGSFGKIILADDIEAPAASNVNLLVDDGKGLTIRPKSGITTIFDLQRASDGFAYFRIHSYLNQFNITNGSGPTISANTLGLNLVSSTQQVAIGVGTHATLTVTDTMVSGSSISTGSFGHFTLPGSSGNVSGHLIPSADSTYDLGSTNSEDWRKLYVREIDIFNQRLGISYSGTTATFTDHSSVGDGFRFTHRGTILLEVGDEDARPVISGSSSSTGSFGRLVVGRGSTDSTYSSTTGGDIAFGVNAPGKRIGLYATHVEIGPSDPFGGNNFTKDGDASLFVQTGIHIFTSGNNQGMRIYNTYGSSYNSYVERAGNSWFGTSLDGGHLVLRNYGSGGTQVWHGSNVVVDVKASATGSSTLLTLEDNKISGSVVSTGSFGHTLSPTAVFSDRIAIGQTSLDSTYELDVTGNINASSYSVFGGIVVGNANRIYRQSEALPFLQLNGTTIQITGGSNASTNNIVNLLRRPDTNFNVVSGSTNLMFVTGSNGGRTEVKDRLTINQSTNANSAGFRMKTSDDIEFASLYNYNSTSFPVAQLALKYGSATAARITAYSNTIRYQASDTSTTAGKHEFYSNNAVIALISATKISGSAQTTGSFGSVVAGGTGVNTFTGDVGIGTTSPVQTLHVHKATTGANFIHVTNTTTGATANDGLEVGVNGGHAYLWLRDDYNMYIGVNNSTAIAIRNNGSVGIGTESPSSDVGLHVNNSSGHGIIRIQGSADKDATLQMFGDRDWILQNDGDGTLGTADNFHLYDLTAGASRIVVDTSGNVEIPGGNISGSSTSTGSFGFVKAVDDVAGKRIVAYSNYGGAGFETSLRANKLLFGYNGDEDAYGEINMGNSYMDFKTNSGANPLFRIHKSGGTIEALSGNISGSATSTGSFGSVHTVGHIGVGTTSPVYPLTVNGTGYFATNSSTNQLTLGDTTNGKIAAIRAVNDTMEFKPDGSTTRMTLSGNGPSVSNIYTPSIVAAGGDSLNIIASGVSLNLGADYDSTGGNIDIYPTGKNLGTAKTVRFNPNTTFFYKSLDITGHVTASGNISGSSTSTGSFGSVLVGTSEFGGGIADSVDIGLQVTTGEQSKIRLNRQNSLNNYLDIVGGSTGAFYNINASGTNAHIFKTSNTERVRITTTGLGIGTTDIDYPLDVQGVLRVSDAIHGFHDTTSRVYARKWIQFGPNVEHHVSATDRHIAIYADQTTDSPILKVGGGSGYTRRVGINTLTPLSALHVKGDGLVHGDLDVTGSLTVQGDVIAKNYIVSSSTTYMTTSFSAGSTAFGDGTDDTHQFTGSIKSNGSIVTDGLIRLDVINGLWFNGGASSTFSPSPYIGYTSSPTGTGWFWQLPNNGTEKFTFKLGAAEGSRQWRVTGPNWQSSAIITGDGRLGLGADKFELTDIPASQLHISGSDSLSLVRVENSGVKLFEITGNKISGSSTSTGSFGKGHFANNLGIGTTSPSALIHGTGTNGTTLRLKNTSSALNYIQLENSANSNNFIQTNAGSIALNADAFGSGGDVRLMTGNSIRFKIDSSGHALPGADNTYNLGSSTARWANIHSADLHLSNEDTKGNEVDGTTGNWTIQEGEDNLYLLNRKNGKKYRFKLEEIT